MDALAEFLKGSFGWELLGLIIALGAVAMALLQLITALTPLRSILHAIWLRRWIAKRVQQYLDYAMDYKRRKRERRIAQGFPADSSDDLPEINTNAAFAQLITQATGGHSRSLFGLPSSQLVAQINAAAQAALENPEPNLALLIVLTQPTEPRVPLILRARQAQPDEDLAEYLEDLNEVGVYSGSYPTSESPELKRYMDARARSANRIQRNLDSMQITLGNDSAIADQIFAIFISICIAYLIVRTEQPNSSIPFLMTIVLGIAGGYAALILSDVVAAIHRIARA